MSNFAHCPVFGLRLERDYENEPYFVHNDFWPTFLQYTTTFDHAYFIDVFVTILGDFTTRRLILEALLPDMSIIHNRPGGGDVDKSLLYIKYAMQTASMTKKIGYITWQYPPVDVCSKTGVEEGEESHTAESHYTMLMFDPATKVVLSFDSRGTDWAPSYHPSWLDSYKKLKETFCGYQWVDMIEKDTQIGRVNDNFCQSWSLMCCIQYNRWLREAEKEREGRDGIPASLLMSMHTNSNNKENSPYLRGHFQLLFTRSKFFDDMNYSHLIDFWRTVVQLTYVKETLFGEIYFKTHEECGARYYDRYFSTVEALVTMDSKRYYAHPDECRYIDSGWTFIEDFLQALTVKTLEDIMR